MHFGAPYAELHPDGGLELQPAALFAGQLTRPLTLRCAGPAGVVGVRFHPDGARALLGRPVRDTNNARLPLDHLWPGAGVALARAVKEATDDRERARIACEFVARTIAASGHECDGLVRQCVGEIESSRAAFFASRPCHFSAQSSS